VLWLLAFLIRILGSRGKRLLSSAEAAAAHCLARLSLSSGRFWWEYSDDEWKHAVLLDDACSQKLSPLDRPPFDNFAPGLSRLACWQIAVGSSLHKLSRGEQVAIVAYFESAQVRFYQCMACLSWGADRALYQELCAHEAAHAAKLPRPCQRCQRREGLAIAALLLWDLPRIYLGHFRYFLPKEGDSGYLGK
jgi:hypothetical protein